MFLLKIIDQHILYNGFELKKLNSINIEKTSNNQWYSFVY